MENLIRQPLKKKVFCERWGIDHTLPKDKLRTELKKKADPYCKWHTEGKGAGTNYFIDEIFNTPKERVHGNKGRAPINKGAVDENSLKYKLAKALILNFGDAGESHPKRYFMNLLGCHFKNFKHIEELFADNKLEDLDAMERLVMKLSNNTSKSLNWMLDSAFDLIRKGKFDGVSLLEDLYIASFDHQHYGADTLDNCVELHDLYKQARVEAETNVNAEYGEFVYFSKRKHLINNEYRKLIESDDEYQLLLNNEIDYMYFRYEIVGSLQKPETVFYDYEALNYDGFDMPNEYESEELANDFIIDFQIHRRKLAVEFAINYEYIGIISKSKLPPFATELTKLLFANDEYETFKNEYQQLMTDVTEIVNTGFGIAS